MAGCFDLRCIKGDEPVALADKLSLFYVAGESVAVHADGVKADVEQDLCAVGDAHADCVVGAGHGSCDDCVCRSNEYIISGFNGNSFAESAGSKDLIGNFVDIYGFAGEESAHLDGTADSLKIRFGNLCCRCLCRQSSRLFVNAAGLAQDGGQDERNTYGNQHSDRIECPELRLDGQDAGQAADADTGGHAAGQYGEHARKCGTCHTADEGEHVLEVDTEDGGLCDAQVTGNAGRNVDFLHLCVLLLQEDHAQNSTALCDVGKGDHRPQHGAAEVSDQLQVDGVGHVMETGDYQRCIDETEDCRKENLGRSCNSCIDNGGDDGTDLPADGAQDEVCRHDGERQAEEGHEDHRDHRRYNLTEEFLQIDQGEGCQHSRNDLRLIADHVDLCETEVPLGDVCCSSGRHCISVQELAGNEGETQDQAQHFGRAHLLGDGPADTDRNTDVEDCLTDQPQEVVNACPELGELDQCVSALENIETVDTVSETEDQTAGDDGRQKRCEDFRQHCRQTLQRILVLFGSLFDRVLGDAGNTGNLSKIIIKLIDRISNDDLELSGLCERSLDHLHGFDLFNVRFARVI